MHIQQHKKKKIIMQHMVKLLVAL